jgi:hypothetical protein
MEKKQMYVQFMNGDHEGLITDFMNVKDIIGSDSNVEFPPNKPEDTFLFILKPIWLTEKQYMDLPEWDG